MKKIEIPYYHSHVEISVDEKNLSGVLFSRTDSYRPDKTEEEIIKEAIASPIGSPPLSELARGKRRVTVVTSDHTRAVPSRITLPIILSEIRKYNPGAEVTILIATGLHRSPTEEEMRRMFGDDIVNNEKIAVNDAFAVDDFVFIGKLPSGADLRVNRIAAECDLLVTEGFIEPHFFAGFSGGRKSILPGVCSAETVNENHSYRAIADRYAVTGELKKNPINIDMVCAARAVNVAFILNVALNGEKKVIAAFAGDLEAAHEKGVEFVRSLACCTFPECDIVVTSNGGYPLDQNLYQSPKAASTAETLCREGGVIILFCSCVDGLGGKNFEKLITSGTPAEIDEKLAKIPPKETIPEQWCAQIYSRILQKCRLILVSELDPETVKKANMIPASSPEDAIKKAYEIAGKNAKVLIIPDGVAVMSKKSEGLLALKVNEKDNVCTIFSENVKKGDVVSVRDKKGTTESITVLEDIPYGHKFAVEAIKKGDRIIKYGESIGEATCDIKMGDYVHIHNLAALRGRGDK